MLQYNRMQSIAETEFDLSLPTRKILVKKNCEISEEDAKLKLSIEVIADKFGVALIPKFISGREGRITIVIYNVDALYDADPDAFTDLCENLHTIDLDVGDEFSAFSSLSDFGEEENSDSDEASEIDGISEEEEEVTIEEEFSEEEIEEIIEEVNEEKEEGADGKEEEVLKYVIKMIENGGVCFFDDIENEFGKKGLEYAKRLFSKKKGYIYDESDRFIMLELEE